MTPGSSQVENRAAGRLRGPAELLIDVRNQIT